jgi:hypothetical protein
MKKTPRESFMDSITVRDVEDFVLVPVAFLKSLRDEVDGLRAQLGLPARSWEPARTDDAVGQPSETPT